MDQNREKVVVRYRRALEQIRDYVGRNEDAFDSYSSVKWIAENILREVDQENKKSD